MNSRNWHILALTYRILQEELRRRRLYVVQYEDESCHVNLEDMFREMHVGILFQVLLVRRHHFDAEVPGRGAIDGWKIQFHSLEQKMAVRMPMTIAYEDVLEKVRVVPLQIRCHHH